MRSIALKRNETVLIPRCWVANTFFSRFMGLMGKSEISSDEAICFPNCNSIHTFFMRMPIDALFLTKEGEVLEIFEHLKPWRLILPKRGFSHVIEMRSGRSRELGITEGDLLDGRGLWLSL